MGGLTCPSAPPGWNPIPPNRGGGGGKNELFGFVVPPVAAKGGVTVEGMVRGEGSLLLRFL